MPAIIIVEKRDVSTARAVQAEVARARAAERFLEIAEDEINWRRRRSLRLRFELALKIARDLRGGIGAAVGDDDDFHVGISLRADAVQRALQIRGAVVRRHDDADRCFFLPGRHHRLQCDKSRLSKLSNNRTSSAK